MRDNMIYLSKYELIDDLILLAYIDNWICENK